MVMNFKDVAAKKLDDIERPPLLPTGTYRWQISRVPETRDTDAFDFVTFYVNAVEALDDVELSDYPGDITKATSKIDFIFDKQDDVKFQQTLYRLRTFLEHHVKCADSSMGMAEALNASVGQQVLAQIIHKVDKTDKDLFHANIGKTAPLE